MQREEAFEGEEIVETAIAARVRKDVTRNEARVTAETIDLLPVQGVCVKEDEHPFLLHHLIQWEGTAAALLTETKKRYGAVVSYVAWTRGFYSPDNLTAFEAELGLAVMPRKGKGTEASRERERAEELRSSASGSIRPYESAINNLEHRGLKSSAGAWQEGICAQRGAFGCGGKCASTRIDTAPAGDLSGAARQRLAPLSWNKQAAETAEKDDAHERNRIATSSAGCKQLK